MANPLISVIMPAYNSEPHLAEAIESVLAQTFGDFELLVVYDQSTDRTEEVVRELAAKDARVRLVPNAHAKGLANSLNTGLEQARGELIARMDADDIVRPYRFAEQVAYLEKHPDVQLLGGGYAPFNEHGHRLDIYHPTEGPVIAWRFLSNTYFAHPTVMFRRAIIEEVGGYPETVAEDYAFFSRVVRRFRVANLPLILIDYRESLTQRSSAFAERIRVSVKNTFLENYAHYIGGLADAELYYAYHGNNVLRLSDLRKIHRLNEVVVKKIRKLYGLGRLDPAVLRLRWTIAVFGLRKFCVTYLHADLKRFYLRPRNFLRRVRNKLLKVVRGSGLSGAKKDE